MYVTVVFKKSNQTIKFWFIPSHGSQKSGNRLWYIESQFSKNLRTSQTSFNEIAGYFKKAADSLRFSVKEIETRVSLTLIFFKNKNKNQRLFYSNFFFKSKLKVLWFLNFLKTKTWGYWNKSDNRLLLDWLKRMWEYVFSHTKGCSSWQVLGKLCGFIYYNVHYAMFVMSCITLKL
jgi:hypothetical protein